MVKKFGKLFRKSNDRKFSKSSKKVDNSNNNRYTCFECGRGKQGHIKSEHPIYLEKHGGEKKALRPYFELTNVSPHYQLELATLRSRIEVNF